MERTMAPVLSPALSEDVPRVRVALSNALEGNVELAAIANKVKSAADVNGSSSNMDDKDRQRYVVELALSDMLLSFLTSDEFSSQNIVSATKIVNLATMLTRQHLVHADIPAFLLQYVLLLGLKEHLNTHIDHVAGAFHLMGSYELDAAGALPMLSIIKAVVLFLRRGLVFTDYVLAGKVRSWLSSALPCWDISGINLKGSFNTGNITMVHSSELVQDGDAGDAGPSSGADHTPPIDWALYNSFWGVQRYLSDPRLVQTLQGWAEFSYHLEALLSVFEASSSDMTPDPPGSEYRWPKFLTSPSLFRFQLTDSHIIRCVLIQYSIVLQHLRVYALDLREMKANDSLLWEPIYAASSDKESNPGTGDKLLERMLMLLSKFDRAEKGSLSEFTRSVLEREVIWIKWKNRGCQSTTPAEDIRDQTAGRTPSRSGRRARANSRPRAISESYPENVSREELALELLSVPLKRKQWSNLGGIDANSAAHKRSRAMTASQLADEWSPLSVESRRNALLSPENMAVLPNVNDYRKELQNEASDQVEDEYRKITDASYVWRCMRAVSTENCELFLKVSNPRTSNSIPAFDLRRLVYETTEKDTLIRKKHSLNPDAQDFEPTRSKIN